MPSSLNPEFSTSNFFETLFKNTRQNTILLMDDKGIITEINSAFTNFFGYTRADIVGKHLSVLFTENDRKLGLPENEVRRTLSEGQSSDNNFLVHRDGSLVWV